MTEIPDARTPSSAAPSGSPNASATTTTTNGQTPVVSDAAATSPQPAATLSVSDRLRLDYQQTTDLLHAHRRSLQTARPRPHAERGGSRAARTPELSNPAARPRPTRPVRNRPYKVVQTLAAKPGTALTVTDRDVMGHTLLQLAGPKVTLVGRVMDKMGAQAKVVLSMPGTYVFGTKEGNDYYKGIVTTGPDNVLRLVVTVK